MWQSMRSATAVLASMAAFFSADIVQAQVKIIPPITSVRPPVVGPNRQIMPAIRVPSDIDNFIEDYLCRRFRNRVESINVNTNVRGIEVEIEVDSYATFLAAQRELLSLPQLSVYRMRIVCDNLDELIERRMERELGFYVDDVDVDVDHDRRLIDVEVEVRHPWAYNLVHRLIHRMPEFSGYRVRLRFD